MLQRIPAVIGRALHSARAGLESIVYESPGIQDVPTQMELGSSGFAHGTGLPTLITADGAGLSPDLQWDGVPAEARSLLLLIEDADSPTPRPLVHALAFSAARGDRGDLLQGVLDGRSTGWMLGRNSYLRNAYLPPDPPPGHGPHRYCFQLFALDRHIHNGFALGRGAAVAAMRGYVIAKALLIGTYARSGH